MVLILAAVANGGVSADPDVFSTAQDNRLPPPMNRAGMEVALSPLQQQNPPPMNREGEPQPLQQQNPPPMNREGEPQPVHQQNPPPMNKGVMEVDLSLLQQENQPKEQNNRGDFFSGCNAGENESTWVLDAGLELTFLRPFSDLANGSVFAGTFNSKTTGNQDHFDLDLTIASAKFGLEFAPRFWVGITGPEGVGARARYWYFDQTTPQRTGQFTGVDDKNIDNVGVFTTTLRNRLEAHVADIEVTSQGSWGHWWLLGSAGFRYLNLTRNAQENFTFVNNTGDNFDLTLSTRDNLAAYGLTVSLEARRFAGGNFIPFVNSRFSILAGDASLRLHANGADEGSSTTFNINQATGSERAVLIGELQAGVEWNHAFRYGEFFVRGAIEAQYWINGIASGGSPSTGDFLSLASSATSLGNLGGILSSDRGALAFIGFVVGAGVRR